MSKCTDKDIVTKNPQAQAIRTKAKGLLFTQLRKNSLDSRPAILDHILYFKNDNDLVNNITRLTNIIADKDSSIFREFNSKYAEDVKDIFARLS